MPDVGLTVPLPERRPAAGAAPNVSLRAFPWPYRAMLAICNDIDDETPAHFAALHQFLNTREMTPVGRGLGLDIADSFWFYAPRPAEADPAEAQLAVFAGLDWRRRSPYADKLLEYIRCGWIDTLHSYGNFSRIAPNRPDRFSRAHAEQALALLREEGIPVSVWSNHGDSCNIQNIEKDDDMPGDVPAHPAYHADLLTPAGVRFIWSTQMSEEFRRERVLTLGQLRDGQKIWKFSRQDIAYREDAEQLKAQFGAVTRDTTKGPMAVVWHPALLHVQLSTESLAELVARGGYAIIGQHLGYRGPGAAPDEVLPPKAVEALYRLKALQDAGGILVARTARLLEYAAVREGLRYVTATTGEGVTVIDITGIDDPVGGARLLDTERLRGITFEVADGVGELRLRGRPIPAGELAERRLPGRHVIGIRWFAPDHTDYVSGSSKAILTWLDRQRETVPAGIDPAAWSSSIHYIRGRYDKGLETYRRRFFDLGWRRMQRGLDGGSGAGHWTIAFALDNEHATGIDTNEALVRLAHGAAEIAGLRSKVDHRVGNIEAMDFPDGCFDAAWCNATLQFCDAENAIPEFSRVLEHGGKFYCGWSTAGYRLSAIYDKAMASDRGQLRTELGNFIGNALHQEGMARTPWSRLPLITADDLREICKVFGLSAVSRPGLQDPLLFAGIAQTADLLCVRDGDAKEVRSGLMDASLKAAAGRRQFRELIRLGLGKLVYGVLRDRGADLTDADLRSLYVLAAVRAGCARDVAVIGEGAIDPHARGVLALEMGRHGDAVSAFRDLAQDHPARNLLLGVALLLSGAPKEAVSEFDKGSYGKRYAAECGFGAILAHVETGDWSELRGRLEQALRPLLAQMGAAPEQIHAVGSRLVRGPA